MNIFEPRLSLNSDVKTMHLNWLSLRFTGETAMLEAPFQVYARNSSLLQFRVAMIIGALVYAFFGILDALLMPQQKHLTWLIRYAFVCPAILAAVVMTYIPRMHRFLQPIMSLTVAFAGLGVVLMIAVAPQAKNAHFM